MPIIVSEIKTPLSAKKEEIISQAIKKAGLKNSDVVSSAINKTSLDARHNDDIKLVSSVCLSLSSEKLECQVSEKKGFKYYEEKECLAVEMEAAALYMTASRLKKNALAICTISDHLLTGEETTSDERQKTFTDMITLALEVAIDL